MLAAAGLLLLWLVATFVPAGPVLIVLDDTIERRMRWRVFADGVEQAVEATLDGADWDGIARQVELDLTIDVREDAARITAPTLLPPSHARPLVQTIAGARYAELPTGHLAPME